MDRGQVKKLAQLARLEVADQEVEGLQHDLESVLGYIQTIESVDVDVSGYKRKITNVMRDDTDAYESETFSERLLAEAPDIQNGSIKVQKIL